MTRLEKICRSQEGVVTIQSVHDDEIITVLLNLIAEVRQLLEHSVTKGEVGKKTWFPRQSLDGHPLQKALKNFEFLGKLYDRFLAREEASCCRYHEGRDGMVLRTSVMEDRKVKRRRHDDNKQQEAFPKRYGSPPEMVLCQLRKSV
jgi:hypothetical protein